MRLAGRLERLEQQGNGSAVIDGWCDLDGLPVDPPADVRRLVEERAPPEPLGRAWRHAVWVPDSPSGAFVALLGSGDELRVVELE